VTEILRAELERLFELDELMSVCHDILGFDPEDVGGTAAVASFAKALTEYCAERESLEALTDAVVALQPDAKAELRRIRLCGAGDGPELESGDSFGDLLIVRKLSDTPLGVAYQARREGNDVRLQVLRAEFTRYPSALQRYLTLNRLISRAVNPGLPRGVETGAVDGLVYVLQEYVEGQELGARVARTGPMHINEARPLLGSVLEALRELHEQQLFHGGLDLDNVLVWRDPEGNQHVRLLGVGTCLLVGRPREPGVGAELPWFRGSPHGMAPELLRGALPSARTDVYAFGALAYHLLSGTPLFGGGDAIHVAVGHLSLEPPAPSNVAPRGWIPRELDEFVLGLLAKTPERRPADASDIIARLDDLRRDDQKAERTISEEELDARVEAVVAAPDDLEAAMSLESAVDEGADAVRIAEAFQMASDTIDLEDSTEAVSARKRLLFRAARMYEAAMEDVLAEQMYASVLALDASNGPALSALEALRRRHGRYEELVEMLLERSENADNRDDRARAYAEIGRLYTKELDDKEQALVAFTQAFCEDPHNETYPKEIERLAAGDEARWEEVLSTSMQATQDESLADESKNIIYRTMANWYLYKVKRPDLALPVYQAVLQTEPSNTVALRGLADIYRKAQQWPELGMVLTTRADAAATPEEARDLRCDAAEILEVQLSDVGGARDLYEQILREDPGHARASEALARIYGQTGDHEGRVKILESRASTEHGEAKQRTLCQIAEIYEDHLNDDSEAIAKFAAALELDETNLDALRGLDRLYSKTGRYHELLENLQAQIHLAATPRQKITLWERVAGIYDEEFLDHEQAAAAFEWILEIDNANENALTSLPRHYRSLERWEDLVALYERHVSLVGEDEHRSLELNLARGRVLAEQLQSPERAMQAYEAAIALDPEHAGALEALARLRETTGDADAAIHAIEALAEKATSPEGKAEQYYRAARLLEERGDRDGAIEFYKKTLDQVPTDVTTSQALRAAYVARGDINAAIQLLEREFDRQEGEATKARLAAEVATLSRLRLKDDGRAEEAAKRSLTFDPTNVDARIVLGDLAFEAKRYLEASRHYEVVADRTETMDQEVAKRVLVRYVDALSQSGSTEQALAPMDTLLRIAPDDAEALERVAQVTFDHGSPKRAVELYRDLFQQFGEQLQESADSRYRFGESLRRAGEYDAAITPLEEASDLDPGNAAPLVSLAKVYEAKSDWDQVVRAKTRHLDIAQGEERVQLLIEVGELCVEQLNDRTRAAKSFVAALEERPDDRRLLTKLMQLYSEEQDWEKLVEVVIKLAEFVDDTSQKAKYLQTAAIVSSRQMGDHERALDFYRDVIQLDPKNEKALDEAIEIERGNARFEEVEEMLRRKLDLATEADDKGKMLQAFVMLGELYENDLAWIDKAIDAYEAAQTIDPTDTERSEKLTELYASDPAKYLDKAVRSQIASLEQNPYRAEPYKLLRRLYTETKQADAAWALCQALYVLNLAEPDEERFYKRMRSDTAAPAREAMTDEDWLTGVMHDDLSPLLTSIFALIEPAVIGKRGRNLQELGYDPHYQVDLARHPYPMSQNLFYAAGVMGLDLPPTYQNPNDPAGLSFLHAHSPSIVMGRAAMATEIPPQAAAFIAARHLCYFRPGLYVRHLVPTGTGLKSWMFAAIKLISPQFPVAPDLEGPVRDALAALDAGVTGQARDHLARVVSQLIQSGGALDLKRWVAGVDLTADRIGLVIAHDLETANEIIKASDDSSSAVPRDERLKQLTLYSISEPFFQLRRKLGVAVDS
jgi:tetratricopeptide (TPR) repeat protein